jgi:aspartate/methionine/tyrosine aminotransferase
MNRPTVSARLRDGKLAQSPIREIMKLSDRQNIIDLGLDPDDVISFAGGWVNHRAPEGLRAQYQRVANDAVLFHELGAYSPTRGLPELREVLVRVDQALYGTEGLGDEHVLVGQSSTQLTHSLFMALLDPGDRVLLFDPSYANYGPQLGFGPEGIEIVRLPVIDAGTWSFMPDADALLRAFDEILERDRPRLMLFSSPDNPTSQMVPDEIFLQMVERAGAAGCFVAVDFAYQAQCFHDEEPDQYSLSPARFPNLIRVHSNSKWCRGLGRRLGWVEAAPEVIDALELVQQSTALCGDTVHQYALANYLRAALGDGSLQRYLEEARQDYRRAAEHTSRCIEQYLGMRHMPPQGGLYCVVDVGRTGERFVREVLEDTGVIFVPGGGFGPSLENAIRVSFGPLVHDLPKIEAGFERVRDYLEEGT